MASSSDKPYWRQLEDWLLDNEIEHFTSRELAGALNVDPTTASMLIGAYLIAQRGTRSETLYVLKRQGRTSRAVWSVGHHIADVDLIGRTLRDDIAIKVMSAFRPDLDRIKAKNPRAARYCEAKIEAVMSGALAVLAVALDQHSE